MKFSFFLILIINLAFGGSLYAQYSPQSESKYKAGVNDYRQQRYAAAMEKLAPLTSSNDRSSYTAYAHYYYALAAYQLKRHRESRQMLLQLISKYPGWNKINDAYYLLGANSLGTGQYKEAMDYLQRIKDSSFSKDILSLKQHYLIELNDLTKLIVLHKEFPDDRDIAIVLVQYIQNSPSSTKTDLQFAQQIESQFKISNKEKNAVAEERPRRSIPKKDTQWTKGYYEVSVLLPFRLDELNTARRRTNQFAYDYYIGLTLAREKLKTEGINVNLWAYDVSNDPKPMKSIIDNNAFRQSDLVIGPLYAGTFDITAEFVSDANMIMLNPLSTDANLLKTSSNLYLAHPSITYQIQKAAQWMKSTSPVMTAAIYYGNTAKDSVMAFSYANEVKSKSGKVVELMKILSDREWLEEKISLFETNKPSHIALFSSDAKSGSLLIDVINGRKLNKTPVLAASTSFNMLQSRVGKYGSRLFLIDTDYIDREKDTVREFQKTYWNYTNTFPSVYSYQGYDQLLFFGRMLNQHKEGISKGLESRKYNGDDYLLSGFDFTKSHDNQITPILRYNSGKWIPVN